MIAVDWHGRYSLPAGATPVAIAVHVHGAAATVSLGPGHAGATRVTLTVRGKRMRFVFPGLPQSVVFDGTTHGSELRGVVRQGRLRGTFALRRGVSRIVQLLGVYGGGPGTGAAVTEADGLPPAIIEFPSGAIHGIGRSLAVGERLGDTHGNGRIVPDATGFGWNGAHYTRLRVRQREVRVGVDAATLSLPPGPGPFPAVAMVHGAGPRTRDEFDIFSAYLELNGIAVIADDKRGVGESGGAYPGDAASDAAIDRLARDAQAEVGFLGRQPEIDRERVGIFGDSQAGWISPLAASRDRAVRWLVSNVGPAVTVGETDYWASLAGESESRPIGTRAQMLALVRRAGRGGFDPEPALRMLSIPAFWMFGGDDRNVPTELCVERLQALKSSHDFSWAVLPTAHTPLVLPTGLLSSLLRSPGFDPGFFPALGGWLRSRGILR